VRRQSHCIHGEHTWFTLLYVWILGFLPIATEDVLLPKLHRRRCVVRLPEGLHVRKSLRKKSKRFSFSVNRSFDSVVQGCHAQHGSACWLYPPLVNAFRELNEAGSTDAMLLPERTTCPVRMYSIEVWNEVGVLVGGELGYTV
jgi:Leu/Phe-tRNA-protein transferase